MRIETIAVHAGIHPDPTTGAVAPVISLATTFERGADGSFPHGNVYTRTSNPNRTSLEESLRALEGGAAAAAFSSGSAATAAVLQSLRPGDHVVAPLDAYHGTHKLLGELFEPWGLAITFVDMRDPAIVRAAMTPRTRLVWAETPSNPLLAITDIAAVAEVAHARGALLACDNTWATPVATRPIALGADIVMHSTTKYLGGHSDVLGGAIVAARDDELFARIRTVQGTLGAVPSPFDCWLVQRGIRTLPWRVRAHSENARAVAEMLAAHPRVHAVHYPGLPTHPGHETAARQMALPGGMVSIQVRGGRDAAMGVASRTRLFTRATSLGGVESLIEHRASVEPPGSRTPDDLLRLSVGLESAEDLMDDLRTALG